ncbi:S8 family serine peptidase [Bdellovibrio bacteriovorus]|uniref:S8 family peptidase n=1 Tax=Bdellovibrio bacteriovorus TaxID=959 RepID=UPI0021CFDFA4|nr:S8 family peptidase [Bdellovibrio bacteriovorus]UXR63901.1 S8 family serine peptidase [Bdellovibrio bacteriovorus]
MNSFSQESLDRDIVVAIIDTGVDVSHPLIKDNLWSNPREKNNQKDNDGNGFAGDLHGWNFVSNNHDLSDHHGHGTHVAGIIQQQAGSSRVKFMILKYYDPSISASDNLLNTVKAIRYATRMKADIINYSGGGDERSPMEEAAIREAQDQGILFVAAAGNEGRNTDVVGYYPAGYKLTNIISVAAMDSQKRLLASSNFGTRSVDIAAPGKNIFSALPDGKYGYMSGTSQATAWVSGLAAALMLRHPWETLTPQDIKKVLVSKGIKDRLLSKKIRSQTRISSLQAGLNLE